MSCRVDAAESFKIQEYLILSCYPVPGTTRKAGRYAHSHRPPPIVTRTIRIQDERKLKDYEIFPINQERGHSLLLLLEPLSGYGLSRYNELGLDITPGMQFPVLRITDNRFKEIYHNVNLKVNDTAQTKMKMPINS
jgi:hypothetical protein